MTMTNLRPELARHLRQRLTAFSDGFRQNLALIGPPGSGKTFQLQQLLAQPPANTLMIYCPLYRESCRSFLSRLLSAILRGGLAALGDGAEAATAQPLESVLAAADRHLPNTAAAVRAAEALIGRRLYGEALSRTLDAVPTLLEERRQPCVLILDEFLFLEELGLGHAFHELGKRVMTWHSTLFILSSSSQHRARTILRERLQLLFGQFELLDLDAVDPAIAASWIRQELRGVRGAKPIIPFLIQWLGGYPWYLAVFLKRLKELAELSRAPESSEALFLNTAWDLLGSPEGTLHHWCASRLDGLSQGRLGARASEALIQIAQGARTMTDIGKRLGRGGLSDAMQLLVEHDLAERNGMCWIIADPLLRCWLFAILSALRADARPGGAEVRQRFEQDLRSLWARWVQAQQLSFSEQVVRLFGRFCDDTVLLDAKTGRLPKFDAIRTHRPAADRGEVYLVADGQGRRWCAAVETEPADENAVAGFEAFCRTQTPKPSRKIVVLKSGMDQNARLLAKSANMWVWEAEALNVLQNLYD
jgi:hypothetical protein